MNKKIMALAVASAFAAPAVALAQSSTVQIYGTAYIEYGYAKQGMGAVGGLNNTDLLQTPGSNIGFKGEENLGGGLSAWFNCESSLDFRGAGSQPLPATSPTQNSGILCGRNSALGLKGAFGNVFAGNWDTPWKQASPKIIGTNETGVFGGSPMLYGNSTSANDSDNGVVFERRQGNSLHYRSPTWSGFDFGLTVSTPQRNVGLSSNATVGKPRLWSAGVNYTNGPLLLTANYEKHNNFNALNGNPISNNTTTAALGGTSDDGYMLGAAYQFGPVKAGVVWAKRNLDSGAGTDASVSTYGLNLDWAIQGPHQLKFAYLVANSTTGSFGANTANGTTVGNLVMNRGAGSTGGSMWEVEYLYNLSKRTRVSFGYVAVSNDLYAKYSVGGFTTPTAGTSQSAFGTSIKSAF